MKRVRTLQESVSLKKQLILVSVLVVLATMVVTITRGNLNIPVQDVLAVIANKVGMAVQADARYATVVWDIRFPRVCLAALAGAALAVAGSTFQGVFRNPLVEPYILGVSSGAACGAGVAIVYFSGKVSISALAFIFAVAAMLLAYGIATRRQETPLVNLILAGVIVASVFSAILNLIKIYADDGKLREIAFWLMGGFYTAQWSDVVFLTITCVVCIGILWTLGWQLNVLSMGDQEAESLGIRVGALKATALAVATFLTATTVAHVGIISWVGLMVPHACRMMIGADHRYVIPFSACLGGFFLVVCDTFARTIAMGEIPVSIVTSILGAPYLVFLLRTNRQVGMQ